MSIPFTFECDREAGFFMDPNEQRCVGYLTDFNGLGLSAPLAKDLQIFIVPFPSTTPISYPPVKGHLVNGVSAVVAVLTKFSWNGGISDPLQFECYVSQENATQLKTLQTQSLKTTTISSFGWWITDYDQETRMWYEQSYPKPPEPGGLLKGELLKGSITVDLTPVPARDGVEVDVYKVSFEIAPAANLQSPLYFANSSTKHFVEPWG